MNATCKLCDVGAGEAFGLCNGLVEVQRTTRAQTVEGTMEQLSTGFRRGHADVDDAIEAARACRQRSVQLREVVGRRNDLNASCAFEAIEQFEQLPRIGWSAISRETPPTASRSSRMSNPLVRLTKFQMVRRPSRWREVELTTTTVTSGSDDNTNRLALVFPQPGGPAMMMPREGSSPAALMASMCWR